MTVAAQPISLFEHLVLNWKAVLGLSPASLGCPRVIGEEHVPFYTEAEMHLCTSLLWRHLWKSKAQQWRDVLPSTAGGNATAAANWAQENLLL